MPDRTLIFVDGENLALRYQEMVRSGRRPASDNVLIGDCFVWNHRVLQSAVWNVKRLSYYTSVVGDEKHVRSIRQQISGITYTSTTGFLGQAVGHVLTTRSAQIIPFVMKKSSKTRKESICDIAIAVDIMRACYRDHADAIWIFSGDGDFLQLIQEVVHSGKLVYASAFSSGLNEGIPEAVDEFHPLDRYFFADDSVDSASVTTP
jgi:uncharacterized LabA/DUF88 family protein